MTDPSSRQRGRLRPITTVAVRTYRRRIWSQDHTGGSTPTQTD